MHLHLFVLLYKSFEISNLRHFKVTYVQKHEQYTVDKDKLHI